MHFPKAMLFYMSIQVNTVGTIRLSVLTERQLLLLRSFYCIVSSVIVL